MPDSLTPLPEEVQSQEEIVQVIQKIPPSGIAFRCDQYTYAPGPSGLQREAANYIVLVPPSQGIQNYEEARKMLGYLEDGIAWALTYADPWGNPGNYITQPDFVDYYHHYQTHPDEMYTLSWFTAPEEDQFKHVNEAKRTFFGRKSDLKVGNVGKDGAIPSENVCSPVVTTLEDIKLAQDEVVYPVQIGTIPAEELNSLREYEFRLKNPKLLKKRDGGQKKMKKELAKPFTGFAREYQQAIVTSYLRNYGRWDFHHAVRDRLMHKLLEAINQTF